jgi:6-phosphogluconolactonase
VYVLSELASTLTLFTYDASAGRLSEVQTASTLPADFAGSSTTAAVVMAPSGRFVYASNRGHDSIAAFGIDAATGRLSPLGQTPTGGQTPRDFNIDPSGKILLAANQDSDTIGSIFVDENSGQLSPTGETIAIERPARVLFST